MSLTADELKTLKTLASKMNLTELKKLVKTSQVYYFYNAKNKALVKIENLDVALKTLYESFKDDLSVSLSKKVKSKLDKVSNYNIKDLLFTLQSEITIKYNS